MTDRIVTGANGRKYITTEPQLHARTYTQAELDAAVAAERERWVKWCTHEMNMHRRELDATGHQRHRGAADALERAVAVGEAKE